MLKTLNKSTGTKSAIALAAALTLMGTAAQADWHSIDIDEGAYMPGISYIGTGDNLIFYNETGSTHTVSGPDGSWTSGPIAPGARYVPYVDKKLPLTFSGETPEGIIMNGEFTYEPAPILDDDEDLTATAEEG